MSEIKTCPMCGGEGKLVLVTKGVNASGSRMAASINNAYIVKCEECGMRTGEYRSDIYQSEDGSVHVEENGADNAVEAWNRREE